MKKNVSGLIDLRFLLVLGAVWCCRCVDWSREVSEAQIEYLQNIFDHIREYQKGVTKRIELKGLRAQQQLLLWFKHLLCSPAQREILFLVAMMQSN